MPPKSYERSRYFAFDMIEALVYTGEEIIDAIMKRYPHINYILVKGQNEQNRGQAESTWKYIMIQQTRNALKTECVLKNIVKDFPGIEIRHIDVTDRDLDDTKTHYIASIGEYSPPHIREAGRVIQLNTDDMTDAQKVDAIRRLQRENKLLKKEVESNAATQVVNNINNGTINNITNNNIIVVVNPSGFESTNHLTASELKIIVAEGVKEGLAELTCQAIDKIHSIDENKNFFMNHPDSKNVKVLRRGGVYEDVLFEKFAKDAPFHYADIIKSASSENAVVIDDLKRRWSANRNRGSSKQKVMRKVHETALSMCSEQLMMDH
jgi:hypothetical protein